MLHMDGGRPQVGNLRAVQVLGGRSLRRDHPLPPRRRLQHGDQGQWH